MRRRTLSPNSKPRFNQFSCRATQDNNPALYRIGQAHRAYQKDFHDITIGNNLVAGGTAGFSAHTGYDDASGWGTPNVANLVRGLVAASQNSQ